MVWLGEAKTEYEFVWRLLKKWMLLILSPTHCLPFWSGCILLPLCVPMD